MVINVGDQCYVRTLTDHWVGRCVGFGPHTIDLEDAAWIADSGRLSEFMARGKAPGLEVEPVGSITVHWQAILPWPHELFREAI